MKYLVLAALVAVMLTGCTTPDFVEPPMEGEKYVIEMTDGLKFSPAKAEIPANSTIIFRNTGSGQWHDVVSEDGAWDSSPRLDPGDQYEVTLTEAGEYTYFCSPHKSSGMTGVIKVV